MNILITGGLGFIGCNAVQYFVKQGHNVFVIDNISRETAKINFNWMQHNHIRYDFTLLDIRNYVHLSEYFKNHSFDVVIHLAAQVAVTLSVQDPRTDFDINALGTLNVLECIRRYNPDAIFINASTNKVYGKIADRAVIEKEDCYAYQDASYLGVAETQQLDFYSPYGCSKGVSDQYTCDYARIYGLKTVTVRQSCIYGPHQFGIEDQGWIAWFIIAFLTQQNISVYGDGKQVRDILFVDDLIKLYEKIIINSDMLAGKALNIGGGKNNALSLRQFFAILSEITGKKIDYSFAPWRPGDQLIFISDNTRAQQLLSFVPEVSMYDGIARIYQWLSNYYTHANIVSGYVENSKTL